MNGMGYVRDTWLTMNIPNQLPHQSKHCLCVGKFHHQIKIYVGHQDVSSTSRTGHVFDKRCLIMDPNGARARVDSHGGYCTTQDFNDFMGFSKLEVIRIEDFFFHIFPYFSSMDIMDSTFLEMRLVMLGPKLGEPQKFKIFSAGNGSS